MTRILDRIFLAAACVLLAAALLLRRGAADPVPGSYRLESGGLCVPTLSLAEDGTFTFTYDALSSYLPCGGWTLEHRVLTCVTADGKYTYQFTQNAAGNFVFDAERSAPVTLTDERLGTPVTDGAEFVRQ